RALGAAHDRPGRDLRPVRVGVGLQPDGPALDPDARAGARPHLRARRAPSPAPRRSGEARQSAGAARPGANVRRNRSMSTQSSRKQLLSSGAAAGLAFLLVFGLSVLGPQAAASNSRSGLPAAAPQASPSPSPEAGQEGSFTVALAPQGTYATMGLSG